MDKLFYNRDRSIQGGTLKQIILHLINNPSDQTAFFYGYQISRITTTRLSKVLRDLFQSSKSATEQSALASFVQKWIGEILIPHDACSINDELLTNIAKMSMTITALQLTLLKAKKLIRSGSKKPFAVPKSLEKGDQWTIIISASNVRPIADAITQLWIYRLPLTYISSFYYPTKNNELSYYSDLFNHLAVWVPQTILKFNSKKRSHTVKFFLKLAKQLRINNDFQGMFAVMAGLNHGSIQRLPDLWDSLPKKYDRLRQEMNMLCSPLNSLENYRKFVQTRKIPIVPYLGVYLSDIHHIADSHDTYIDPWNKELYNLSRILAAGRHLQTFFEYTSTLKQETPHLCDDLSSLIYHIPLPSENVAYFRSLTEKPLKSSFEWDLSTWTSARIKSWCETTCNITDAETINNVIFTLKTNRTLNSKNLVENGIVMRDRKTILQAQKQELSGYAEMIRNKSLDLWSTEELCFWINMKEYPKSIVDAIFSAGWDGRTLRDKDGVDKNTLREELGVDHMRLCVTLSSDLESLRTAGGANTEALLSSWSKNVLMRSRRISFSSETALLKPAARSNSDSQVLMKSRRISSFCETREDFEKDQIRRDSSPAKIKNNQNK